MESFFFSLESSQLETDRLYRNVFVVRKLFFALLNFLENSIGLIELVHWFSWRPQNEMIESVQVSKNNEK